MMATSGAISPKACAKINLSKLYDDKDNKKKSKADSTSIELASAQNNEDSNLQQNQSSNQNEMASNNTNLPASPASKGPMRGSELRPTALDLNNPSIVIEQEEESPVSPPISAGLVI